LLTLLVAYQTLWDFLDNVSERGAIGGRESGEQLHRALVEALDPRVPISDYYSGHPWGEDGGYLRSLVTTCRSCCVALPSYPEVRPLVIQGVRLCSVQSVNHIPDSQQRTRELKAWARRCELTHPGLRWFELTAATSALLPHALLALAADPTYDATSAAKTHAAYFPWMALAVAMLDSYVDLAEDTADDKHSYVSHYRDERVMSERLREILTLTVRELVRLPNGHRHVVIAASMMAMYFSAPVPSLTSPNARQIATGGGSLTELLIPAARLWRTIERRRTSVTSTQVRAKSGKPPRQVPLPASLQTLLFWCAPFQYLRFCRRRYGATFALNATSHPPLVFFSEAQEVKSVLRASEDVLHPGEGGATVSPIVGERSFMLSDGEEHGVVRKSVVAAFHTRVIGDHAAAIADAAERAVATWPTDTVIALHPELRSLTLEVILRALVGRFTGPLDDTLITLHQRVLQMLTVTANPIFVEPRLRRGPGRRMWQEFLLCRAQVDELLEKLIYKQAHVRSSPEGLLARLSSLRNPDGSPMSAKQVRDNAMSLILAGHETTASQLSWAFQLLAHNPPAADRLHREIDEGLSEKYLTATVQEILRHSCVFVFAIPRAVVKPATVGHGVYYPPSQLLPCIYLLHHDPKIYPDPHSFRPERFLNAQPDPRAWIPWGGGRKRCPGLHLATLEMKTVLRTVLARRTVHPASARMERPRWRSVIVTPHAGSRVTLRSR
jgi:cytochrome P450